jgi:hypothetical protein
MASVDSWVHAPDDHHVAAGIDRQVRTEPRRGKLCVVLDQVIRVSHPCLLRPNYDAAEVRGVRMCVCLIMLRRNVVYLLKASCCDYPRTWRLTRPVT